MAHFAKIDDNNIVVDCIVISNNSAPDPAPSHSEPTGQQFIAGLAVHDERMAGTWLQTSYSGAFRKRFAGIGFRYDPVADVFIEPSPYPSWILDADHDWQPPTPYPTDGGMYYWDEGTLAWVPSS